MDKPEFRSIGHLVPTIVNMPIGEKDGMTSGSMMKSRTSGITTSPNPATCSPTAQQPGASGSVATSSSTVTAAARKAQNRDLKTSLSSSVRSCLAAEWKAAEIEVDGWEPSTLVATEVFCGYRLTDIPPEADLETARSTVREKLAEAGHDAAVHELTRLWVTTRKAQPIGDKQKELMLAAYIEDLQIYPEDILKATCRKRPRWEWWPALGRLLEHADALLAEWQMVADALSPEAVERAMERKAAEALEAEAAARRREEVLAYQAERQRRFDEAATWRRQNPGPYPDPTVRRPLEGAAAGLCRSLKEAETVLASFSLTADEDALICAKWGLVPTELTPTTELLQQRRKPPNGRRAST
jgi:hypothetical protein